ncbi:MULTISPECIES: hypothetical protein [Bacillaceae]|uniref:Uncharacterized protein n=1 Tax=Alkalicoccobacillus plakortidis TaxID=444060 RepID=A0A9D5DNR8_9BACI|nr:MULTISPECIES: hypothetical protein [Bacillaceae]KQL57242.1 hypothetical protein AN965_09850 [Alkalicoccobacillus plakortidis]
MDKLSILDNATDSFQHGIHHLYEYVNSGNEITDIKQAIVNLINSIDLFVLERLRMKDEDAIYAKQKNKSNDSSYRATIHVGTAFKMLEEDLSSKLTEEEESAYKILKILRDSAIHTEFAYGEDSDENVIFLLHFIARFIDEELDITIEDLLISADYEFYLELIEGHNYHDVVTNRIEQARKQDILREIYSMEYERIKDGGPDAVLEFPCDDCGEFTVAANELLGGEQGECLLCHYNHSVAKCDKCEYIMNFDNEGREMFEDVYFCDSCFDHFNRQ